MVSVWFFVRAVVLVGCAYGAKLPLLGEATAEELALGLERGDFTSVELVKAYIARIMEVNSTLHMVTELNPDAIQIAASLDEERACGNLRGPLHGLPILIKNNIATADLMNNTAGSWSLVGAKVPRDSTVASKLRSAGAILLGKANLSQWANYRSANSSNGWSAYGGQTYGAYYPRQDPSGSSSGSAVSASLGLAWGTLGTETDGSIISPSEVNNVVGIKPTVGLTSRALVIPISEHQDSVGPIARTVKDAAYILQAIVGPDPADNYTSAIPWVTNATHFTVPDYVGACQFDALRGKRIGVPRNAIGRRTNDTAALYDAFESALLVMKHAGAIIIDNTNYTAYTQYLASDAEGTVLSGDFKPNLAAYLAQLTVNPNNVTSLADITTFTQTDPKEQYPFRDTQIFEDSLALNFSNTDAQFYSAYTTDLYLGGPGGLLGALDTYGLDAVVVPSSYASGISAIIGGPVITVPLGSWPNGTAVQMNDREDLVARAPGVPFGIGFAGARWSEEGLVGVAYGFEQRWGGRGGVKPYLGVKSEIEGVKSEIEGVKRAKL